MISFLLPAGGAIVTVRNLQRLGQVDAPQARRMIATIAVIFALGYAGLIAISAHRTNGSMRTDAGTSFIMSVGTAVAAYLVQAASFRSWRSTHPGIRTDSVLRGIGVAAIFYLITLLAAAALAPIYLGIATIVSRLGG